MLCWFLRRRLIYEAVYQCIHLHRVCTEWNLAYVRESVSARIELKINKVKSRFCEEDCLIPNRVRSLYHYKGYLQKFEQCLTTLQIHKLHILCHKLKNKYVNINSTNNFPLDKIILKSHSKNNPQIFLRINIRWNWICDWVTEYSNSSLLRKNKETSFI